MNVGVSGLISAGAVATGLVDNYDAVVPSQPLLRAGRHHVQGKVGNIEPRRGGGTFTERLKLAGKG